jgi:membrane protease YdiL (CAAX protease family)
MFLILILAVLIACLTFSVLIFGYPPGMDYGSALYINSIFAMLIVLLSAVWLVIYWLEKHGIKTSGWIAGSETS